VNHFLEPRSIDVIEALEDGAVEIEYADELAGAGA
jgi:hypothetical protein